jgi:hypothetical protein
LQARAVRSHERSATRFVTSGSKYDIGRIRSEGPNARTPIVLVRALSVPLVHDQGAGPANQALRQCVLRVLRPRSAATA